MSQNQTLAPPKPPRQGDDLRNNRKLVEAAIADPSILEKLTKTARTRLQSYSILGSHAEDLVGDTIARAWEKVETYNPEQKPILNWLYGYLNNVILEFSRRNRKIPRTGYDDSMFEKLVTEADQQAELIDSFIRAKACLRELPANTRRVFEMRVFDDCSYGAIAKRLGITEVNARQIFNRTKQELKEQLADSRTEGQS